MPQVFYGWRLFKVSCLLFLNLLLNYQNYYTCSYFDFCWRFVQYLFNFVFKVHENDHDTDSASPILNSYNPESGCAYYFTEHGNKLQLLPGY